MRVDSLRDQASQEKTFCDSRSKVIFLDSYAHIHQTVKRDLRRQVLLVQSRYYV
jgi:hypothetical protein